MNFYKTTIYMIYITPNIYCVSCKTFTHRLLVRKYQNFTEIVIQCKCTHRFSYFIN